MSSRLILPDEKADAHEMKNASIASSLIEKSTNSKEISKYKPYKKYFN